MNTKNYDRIIDLYLDGALGPVEEREFRNLLEIDADLRRLFEAELAVRATLEEDAEAIPVETERSYTKFLAALAASAPAAGGAEGSGGASAVSGTSGGAGRWLSAGMVKLAGAIVVTLGMAGAGYLAFSDRDGIRHGAADSTDAPAAAAGAPATIEQGTPLRQPASAVTPGDHPATAAQSATNGSAAARATSPLAPEGARPAERSTSAAEPDRAGAAVARPQTKALVDPHDDMTEIDQRSGNVDNLPVIESDSVDTRVRLKNRSR